MTKELLFVVEDDQSIRELVKYALETSGFEVATFETAEEMLAEMKVRMPKLVLLDIMLPGTDGIETLKILRERYKNMNLKIIMLTAKSSELTKVSGLNGGADDFITKPFSVLELVARINANLRKHAAGLSSEILSLRGLTLNLSTREVYIGEKKINLTLKEFELLKILMQNLGNVVEREKLLEHVWGLDYYGQTRTLDIHIKTLREKLDEFSGNILTFKGIGYCLKEGL